MGRFCNSLGVMFVALATAPFHSALAQGVDVTRGFSVREAPLKSERGENRDEQHGLDLVLHQDATGKVRPDLFRESLRLFKALPQDQATQWLQDGPTPAHVNAYLAGNGQRPGPNSGAVMDLAIDPSGSSHTVAYAISNDGGVWKTVNAGATWVPKTDRLDTLSFGALAMDPANPLCLYAGTGNIFNNGYFKAIGVYRTEDGGETWTLTKGSATLNGIAINRMVMPSSNVLLVGTQQGMYRSVDRGDTFTQVAMGDAPGGYVTDLDLNPGTSSPVWAAVEGRGIFVSTDQGATFGTNLWGNTQSGAPAAGRYGFVSMGVSADGTTMYANAASYTPPSGSVVPVAVWKSTDSGKTWSDITTNALAPGNYTRGSRSIPDWRRIANCQCGYDQTLGVDPQDPNRVYMGFQDLWRSDDGGQTWTDVSYDATYTNELMHVDHHAMVFSPPSHRTAGQPTGIWVGNDGGIWSSQDNGGSWTNHNSTISSNLFRGIDTGRGAGSNVWTYGGMQDTGTAAGSPALAGRVSPPPTLDWFGSLCQTCQEPTSPSPGTLSFPCTSFSGQQVTNTVTFHPSLPYVTINGQTYACGMDLAPAFPSGYSCDVRPPNPQEVNWVYADNHDGQLVNISCNLPVQQRWTEFLGGDGGRVAVDPTNPKYGYGLWGSILYSSDGGQTKNWSSVTCDPGLNPGSYSDLAVDTARNVYAAGTCSRKGQTQHVLFRSTNFGATFEKFFQTQQAIAQIALSPADTHTIWLSYFGGGLGKVTIDDHGTPSATTYSIPGAIPNQTASLGVDSTDDGRVLAVFAGYSGQSPRSRHVFLTQDGGSTWQDVSGGYSSFNVPDMPVYAAAFDSNTVPHAFLVATDLGVLRSLDFGNSWHVLGVGLPNVHAIDLAIDTSVKPSLLKVGTYGRSTWKATLTDGIIKAFSPKAMSIGNITFTNRSTEQLELSWRDFSGKESVLGSLPPGQSEVWGPCYYLGVIVVRDQQGNIVLLYINNGNSNQVVEITPSAVAVAKSNALTTYPGLRSIPGGSQVANFNVFNKSSATMTLNWIDYDGVPRTIGLLTPGQSTLVMFVYFGGTFTLANQNGIVEVFVASGASGQDFVVTDQLVNFWK